MLATAILTGKTGARMLAIEPARRHDDLEPIGVNVVRFDLGITRRDPDHTTVIPTDDRFRLVLDLQGPTAGAM